MSLIYNFLIFVVVKCIICKGQFILEPKTFCKFDFDGKPFEIIGELSVITVKSRQLSIAISPCVHFSRLPLFSKNKKFRDCNSKSKGCIIDGNSVINAGDKFEYTEILEEGQQKEKVLVSLNGDKCKDDVTYRIIIHFNCNGIKPSYIPPYEDEDGAAVDSCTYHIQMIAPNCSPHCMVRIGGQYVNLKPLSDLPDVIIPIEGNRNAVLSMCRSTATCSAKNDTVACEVELKTMENGNTGIVNVTSTLGTLSTQKIFWDENNQQLYFRSQIGTNKRNKRVVEIRLVCDWNSESISKTRITKKSEKIVIFEIESKYGCVKKPPICKINSDKKLFYNLENLYKSDNYILNTKNSNLIALNICGTLKMPLGSLCQKSNSQICDKTGNINYGSVMKPISIDPYENYLSTTLIGGSTCASNISLFYSTNIKFICSLTNKQPKFINEDKCSVNILWETLEACPKYISSGINCKVPSIYFKDGMLDLNELRTPIDRNISLSKNLKLRYNFCGKLNSLCNNKSGASMCLINNREEIILGQESSKVTFENGVIRSYFYNGNDFDENKPNVNVSFVCDHNQLKDGAVSVDSVQDKISYQMIVATPLACYSDVTYPCTYKHENEIYDLTPLMKNDSNYELSNSQFKLQINICRPVITNSHSLCHLNSLACLTNLTEPHISNRFLSLGRKQKIDFEKGLVLKYTFGTLCPNSRSFAMETTVLFSCSTNEESGPVLFESNQCNHTITWATKFACPKKLPMQKRSEKECSIQMGETIIYNFTALRKNTIEITLEYNNSLKLNICSGEYTLYHEKESITEIAPKTLHLKDNNPYLEFELLKNYSVILNLQCDHNKSNEGFEMDPNIRSIALNEKIINVVLRSYEICPKNITNIKSTTISPEIQYKKTPKFTEVDFKHSSQKVIVSKENNTKINCFLTSPTFTTFALNNLPPIYVQSIKHSYYIDFNNTINCQSYICRDNKPFEHRNNTECPKYYFDNENLSVKFALLNDSNCKNTDLRGVILNLECSDEENTSTVIQESDCYIVINCKTELICPFSNNLALVNNTEFKNKYKLAGIIVTCILVTIALVFTILRYFRKKRQISFPPLNRNTEFISLVKQD